MYRVTKDTLIPRPDTEHVVEHIIKRIKKGGALLDLCTGSGCIAISTLCHTIDTTAVMVDISKGATEVALENAKTNRVEKRCHVICADIKELTLDGFRFDIISSNPPYVKTDVVPTLEKECSFEPYIAFDGGCDGMDFYKLILERFSVYLKKDGCFIFEIGYDQGEDIVKVCRDYGFCCDVFKDYGKNDRVAVCYR
jgi:release factor glutamine methyltransferase